MKSFEERNPITIGVIGTAVTVGLVLAAFNYTKLPLFNDSKQYSAYFAEAGGLLTGAAVQVAGSPVGTVDSVSLDGPRVLVTFNLSEDIRIGDRSEAAIKTKSMLGAKIVEVTPRGDGTQAGPIPVERTASPYQLPDALGDLSSTIGGLDTDQVSDSLQVLADTFADTPSDLRTAVEGVARFSQTIDARDAQLRNLLASANQVTGVLSERSEQVATLIADSNGLLVQLTSQSGALDTVSANISAVIAQIKGTITDNRDTLKPALEKLNGVLTVINNRKEQVQRSLQGLSNYALSLGEALSSGPFFKAYLANLLPGQYMQPFVEAAFSDLGLDPATLAPSEISDPQTGQPGTPALPVPYPRTGQGGPPQQNLPDAITGKPGDSRYPYREPLPAPPAGGPPPGPPAPIPPELQYDPAAEIPVLQAPLPAQPDTAEVGR